MPDLNWNDLRIVLAVWRGRTLADAARRLRIDETTVARRLAGAEAAIGMRLFDRIDGALQPTELGETVLAEAERAEQAVLSIKSAAEGTRNAVAGTVRLTAVPIVANRLLAPALPELTALHPDLRIELISEPRDLSLSRREADIALRLARPASGAGARTLSRRLGTLEYAIYASAGLAADEAAALPWICYDEQMGNLPHARWLSARAHSAGAASAAFNDAEAILQAVVAGIGVSLLPRAIADRHPALRHCPRPDLPDPPAREVWLLSHPDQRGLPRVAAVVEWLERTLTAAGIRS